MKNSSVVVTLIIFSLVIAQFTGCAKKLDPAQDPLLFDAVKAGDITKINAAIKAGANINAVENTDYGFTPLMIAAEKGDVELIKFLISKKPDLNQKDKFWGQTALFRAMINNQTDTLKLLIKSGADVNVKSKCCGTLLHHAANSVIQEWLVQAVLDAKPDLTIKDDSGKTAMDIAKEKDLKYFIELLNKAGAK